MTEKNFETLIDGEWYRLRNGLIHQAEEFKNSDWPFKINGVCYTSYGCYYDNGAEHRLDAIEHVKVTIEPMPMPMPKKKVVKALFYFIDEDGDTALYSIAQTKEETSKKCDREDWKLLRWPAFPGSEIEVDEG